MTLNGKMSNLKGKDGAVILPVTSSKAVFMEDGQTSVDGKFAEVDSQLDTNTNKVNTVVQDLNNKANKNEVGAPLIASSVSEMTDKTKVYVNTTDGKWYSWNGTAWSIGGVYNSQGIGNDSIANGNLQNNYNFNSVISDASFDLKTLNRSGFYLVTNALDLPVNKYSNCYLHVSTTGRFVIQIVHDMAGSMWSRTIDRNNMPSSVPWCSMLIKSEMLMDNIIKANHLPNEWDFIGLLDEGANLNSIAKNGSYFAIIKPLNAPNDASSSNLIIQQTGNYNFKSQILHDYANNNVYTRTLRSNGTFISEWKKLRTELPFSGKTLVRFGDSITEFGDVTDTTIRNSSGFNVINVGFGGCRMVKHFVSSGYDGFSMTKLADAIVSGDFSYQDEQGAITAAAGDDNSVNLNKLKAIDFTKVSHITIGYSTNDFAGGIELGSVADMYPTNETFCGAVNYVVKKICTKYPNVKITFLSPTWRSRLATGDGKDCDMYPNDNGVYLREFYEKIKELCLINHVNFIDMFNIGINKYNYSKFLTDGLHFTDFGNVYLGEYISNALK